MPLEWRMRRWRSVGTFGMVFNHRKSVTYRLNQGAKAHRGRLSTHLARIGLHPGQEQLLKALTERNGQSMGELADGLGVQPPTITKMITRLAQQNLVERRASDRDGRQSCVFITPEGQARSEEADRAWKRTEKEALAGISEKERRRLRKLLKAVESNLAERLPEPQRPTLVIPPADADGATALDPGDDDAPPSDEGAAPPRDVA